MMIEEVKAFQSYLMTHNLSAGQIALWYALRFFSSGSGWTEYNNNILRQLTGLSQRGLDKAREALELRNLIEYQKGRYRMVNLESASESALESTAESAEKVPKKCQNSAEESASESALESTAESAEKVPNIFADTAKMFNEKLESQENPVSGLYKIKNRR